MKRIILKKINSSNLNGGTRMKFDLNRRELQLIKLWWLSCEDMMVPNGTCTSCEFKDECEVIRQKLYGKKLRSNGAPPVNEEQPITLCVQQHDP